MCGGGSDYVEESQYERDLIDMADRQLQHYNELYVPLEYQQMADINRYRGNTFKQGSMDKSVNAARMATPTTGGVAAGMDPGSGNVMLQSVAKEQQAGTTAAMGSMAGLQAAEDLYAQGTMNLVAAGRQQESQSMTMASNIAQQQAGVIAAQKAAAQTVSDAKAGMVGTIAGGAAAGYYGSMKKPDSKALDMVDGGFYQPGGGWVDLNTYG